MIKKLQNNDLTLARNIRSVFQESYKVEAELLNVKDFPPLKRNLESYVNSENDFYGFLKNKELAGVIEISHEDDFTHIHSLVVSPNFFRQGIAAQLMEFVLHTFFESKLFTVETGAANKPAIALYLKFDFKEVKKWKTDHGIRKVRFHKPISSIPPAKNL
ncbi:GNAT family N-acetyltransferase [uncultured Kriegella sp.]|uniref:GNAT family N-acetyltransferase n=1 Tax=uncultured Kriegella sp. TaxID=1798910 RepID=UPI0030DA2821|tara:strand:- start:290764 stop:291243 length:480 start_codon:yes stop_codon:yes gene_type:complete